MFPIFSGSNPSGYNLTRSLRFCASASAYLSRTPVTATNRTTWTWSGWVKLGYLNTGAYALFNSYLDDNNRTTLYYQSNQLIGQNILSGSADSNIQTSAVYRDSSAWYHVMWVYDSTNATAANRSRIYVNGVLATTTTSYPSASATSLVNYNCPHNICRLNYSTPQGWFDGYLTEVNFIDGQALTPSSFGSYNSTTGVWQPARYTGTYGTNGFYLPFTDNSALTTASNVGLGKDFSGNGNYWTTNNISITAGATYDSMTDVPTLTSSTAANFAVLNPLVSLTFGATLTNGNLNFVGVATSQHVIAQSTAAMPSGKWYAEFTLTAFGGANLQVGIIDVSTNVYTANPFIGSFALGYAYVANAQKYNNGTATSYGATYTTNDVIGVTFDTSTGTLTFYKNNTSQGAAYTGITGNYAFVVDAYNSGSWVANFGQQPFSYTPPTGFVALNTYNLPTGTILQGNKVMDATLWTGNGGASQAVTNAGTFKPDLVWMKTRNQAYGHLLFDSVRGTSLYLQSNGTGAEVTDTTMLSSINSNGFTVGSSGFTNGSGNTEVGWQWQAGQGSSSSNTNGTITSTVSVNASAGFSVVTYTGNGTAGATIGHGLGVAPPFIIIKNRTGASNWIVMGSFLGANKYLLLQASNAVATGAPGYDNGTLATSSVFSVSAGTDVNGSPTNYVAYCWAEIAGYSKFGSYTGNGSADRPFVYLGFKPKFILIKADVGGYDWDILDSSRNTFNVANARLFPNLSNVESTSVSVCDFLSNGFKIRTTNPNENPGATVFYAAFAENPFKNSLAR